MPLYELPSTFTSARILINVNATLINSVEFLFAFRAEREKIGI